jgi:solute carrier family 25 (mitochondrial ornithine transporter) member 2/15
VARDIFSASLGSVACCYTGQPFDTIKVRMQTSPQQYPSFVAAGARLVTTEGVTALWKGSVPTAVGMIFENGVAFGMNEALHRAFPEESTTKSGPPDLVKPFWMGAVTGCCSALVLIPSEVVKAKLQVAVGAHHTTSSVWKKMVQAQGWSSLVVGLDAQLARDAAFYAVFFGGYKFSCYCFATMVPSMPEELNFFISGGLAGMLGWTVAMPLDVPKTNVQSRYDTRVVGSYWPELVRIARAHGLRGLYAGWGPTVVRAFPANAALFLGVELGKRCFDRYLWAPP